MSVKWNPAESTTNQQPKRQLTRKAWATQINSTSSRKKAWSIYLWVVESELKSCTAYFDWHSAMSSVWLWLQLPTYETDLCSPRHMGASPVPCYAWENRRKMVFVRHSFMTPEPRAHSEVIWCKSSQQLWGAGGWKRKKKWVVGSASPRLENKQ